jgi:hypothetical protein
MTSDPDDSFLQWLAQCVHGSRRELAELVEEQHTSVRKRHFARMRASAPAADECGD